MNSRYVEGKGGDGAISLKPFLDYKSSSNAFGAHLYGKRYEIDFHWYVEDKKWPSILKFVAS